MIRERKCPECGATFKPENHRIVCCSEACRAARTRRLDRDRCRKYQENLKARRKSSTQRKAMLARLAARDAAYAREYGHPSGRPRGQLTVPLTSLESEPCTSGSLPPIARFATTKLAYRKSKPL